MLILEGIMDSLLFALQLFLSLLCHDIHDRPGCLGGLLDVLRDACLSLRVRVNSRLLRWRFVRLAFVLVRL